mmetsp:Transcript_1431/g.2271  ORF Transcript_1431/g.2271 Transcript_1431/m.2271 type:complete len:414 (+) Transcript_1431:73-1314(+)
MQAGKSSCLPLLGTLSDEAREKKMKKGLFLLRSTVMFVILALINLGLLLLAAAYSTFEGRQEFFSLALLAWTFGLRHAVDADHIAAIDNVTRKLVGQGQIPVSVGLMFGIGHSFMVLVISCITIVSAATLRGMEGPLADFGRLIGTLFSAIVLLVLGILNVILFLSLLMEDKNAQPGSGNSNGSMDGGCFTRCLSGAFRLVDSPWKMFFLGLVFSLSFDTSTEVALLVLIAEKPIVSGKTSSSAEAAKENGSVGGWQVAMAMVLPLLFAAGMTIIDAADGVGMAWAYAYGQERSHQRRMYNLIITGVSAFVALGLGVLEVLQVIAERMDWHGGIFWETVESLDPGAMGYAVLAMFGILIFTAVIYETFTYYSGVRKTTLDEEVSPTTADYHSLKDHTPDAIIESSEKKYKDRV